MKDIRIIVERLWQEGQDNPEYKDKVQTLGKIQVLDKNQSIVLDGYCIELADKDNQVQKSRIPQGDYEVIRRTSPKFGNHLHILDVPGRTWILIHSGNYGTTDTLGCLLPGYDYKDINGDGLNDVTDSKKFLSKMLEVLPQEKFIMRVIDDNPLQIDVVGN